MRLYEEKSRDAFVDAIEFAAERFADCTGFTDAEYSFFSFKTVCAASVSNPKAPPAPKKQYPFSMQSISVFLNFSDTIGRSSGGIFLCPVKQTVFSFKKIASFSIFYVIINMR